MSETLADQYEPSPDSPPPAALSEFPPSPPQTVDTLHNNTDLGMSDIMLWRRKQLNIVILGVATAAWVLMEVYQYTFITLVSWAAVALVSSCFFWGNMHRILKREAPDLSNIEIKEETSMEHARLFKQSAEDLIRLMLHVSGQRQWFEFAGVVSGLYLMSLVAAHLDFLTIFYIGLVGMMTIPVIYVKKEEKIREFGKILKMKSQRCQAVMEEKLREMKSKIGEKKTEIKGKKKE